MLISPQPKKKKKTAPRLLYLHLTRAGLIFASLHQKQNSSPKRQRCQFPLMTLTFLIISSFMLFSCSRSGSAQHKANVCKTYLTRVSCFLEQSYETITKDKEFGRDLVLFFPPKHSKRTVINH